MKPSLSLHSLSNAVLKLAWILFLIFLPVTSFPYFPPALGGGALVRPLSLFPLIVVILLGTLPRLFTRPLPKTLLALLPFVLVAIAGSLLAVLRGVEGTLGISVAERLARAWITLAIGAAIYLSVALVPDNLDDLRSTLRWLYAGFAAALAWGSLQAVYVVTFIPRFFRWIDRIQQHISIRHLFTNRISGEAAYRIGTGLVTLAVPFPLHQALAGALPEATWLLLPHELGVIAGNALEVLIKNLGRATSLLIGPGLGMEQTTETFISRLVHAHKPKARPMVGF
ncbi:MAG TPA: hypothetical protein VF498_02825, partial [Anaerolineales bacterium]